MKLNRKGFTLVELLAVIVVLSIIALIGYTAVGPIINNSRNSSAENNILQYIHAVELGCSAYQAANDGTTNISIANALTMANFTGTAPTPESGFILNGSTCKLTPITNSEVTSLDVRCTYNSSESDWTCGK